jgi:hypothetical protein
MAKTASGETNRATCPWCGRQIAVTTDHRYRIHGPRDEPCDGSEMIVVRGVLMAR